MGLPGAVKSFISSKATKNEKAAVYAWEKGQAGDLKFPMII